MAALVMQHLTIGTSLFAILVLQALMLAGALYLLLRLAPASMAWRKSDSPGFSPC
uniref:Uncharacterized protein n=1 Tax=Phenylobacterium glaciei TaxID=2803784 RepID=A0A974P2F3_9CAUL|nr:hypothetical protein JKL49_25575 [Phenylobacterium glaciei]